MSAQDGRLAAIEAIVCREVGRGAEPLMAATRGELAAAAKAIAGSPAPRIGIITGFFVVPPRLDPAMAETDGPVGAAHLAAGFAAAGWPVRVATDAPCANAVAAALRGAGAAPAVGLDVVAGEGDVAASIAAVAAGWRAAGITHAIAIERCGRAADGAPYNMRGISVAGVTAPLDDLFTGGPWTRIGIGDGGNEVGMGKLPAALIAASVPNGAKIACVTPADHLVVCGVSNWGAYGLLTAMAALRPDLAPALRSTLTGAADRRILDTLVRDGPAGDPVAGARAASVDGYPHEVHAEVIARLDAALSS